MKDTAIVILNYNGRHFLEKFLPSVLEFSAGARVVVADNASTDDSVEWLKNSRLNVELLQIEKNLGYSGGYNEALRRVDAKYYVLLNSDVEVSEGWLKPIVDYLDEHPEVAAIQPKILDQKTPELFEYAGAGGGFIDEYGFPFCRGRMFNTFEKDAGQYDDIREIFWASGACLIIRSTDCHESGALDPDFFAHMEEIDLCWRVHGSGRKIVYFGQSKVFHVGGGTLKKSNPRKTYLNFRNGLSLLYKNLPDNKVSGIMFARTTFDFIAILRFIGILQLSHAWAVVKAHAHFWSQLGVQRKKRKEAQAYMRVSNVTNIYPGSVVFEYFLGGKHQFPRLSKRV